MYDYKKTTTYLYKNLVVIFFCDSVETHFYIEYSKIRIANIIVLINWPIKQLPVPIQNSNGETALRYFFVSQLPGICVSFIKPGIPKVLDIR